MPDFVFLKNLSPQAGSATKMRIDVGCGFRDSRAFMYLSYVLHFVPCQKRQVQGNTTQGSIIFFFYFIFHEAETENDTGYF